MAPQQPPRAPPRFVPTLTEVVQTPGGLKHYEILDVRYE